MREARSRSRSIGSGRPSYSTWISCRSAADWPGGISSLARQIRPWPESSPPFCVQYTLPSPTSTATPTHHLVGSSPGTASCSLVSTSVSTREPSRLARITRMPSRSDQYSLPVDVSICSCLGVNVAPDGTIVVTLRPSRSERIIEPSFTFGLPMLVQYRCPLAASTANPSGNFLPSTTIVLRSPPSRVADTTRSPARSRKKRRPLMRRVSNPSPQPSHEAPAGAAASRSPLEQADRRGGGVLPPARHQSAFA